MSNSIKTENEKSLSWHGLYILADRALLPARVATAQGEFDIERVRPT